MNISVDDPTCSQVSESPCKSFSMRQHSKCTAATLAPKNSVYLEWFLSHLPTCGGPETLRPVCGAPWQAWRDGLGRLLVQSRPEG